MKKKLNISDDYKEILRLAIWEKHGFSDENPPKLSEYAINLLKRKKAKTKKR